MRILLIEDYAAIARPLTLILEREGFEVAWAASGGEALQLVQAEPFDVIIADIWLADVDGFSLMRKLRSRCDAPAIAFSGEAVSHADMLAAGFIAAINKTNDISDLVATIRRAVPSHPHTLVSRQRVAVA